MAIGRQKQFNVKLYTLAGAYLTTLRPKDIVQDIKFRSEKNGGFGQAKIVLNLPFDDFGEGGNVNFMNRMEVYEVDASNPLGRLIYTGFMSGYKPVAKGSRDYVEITCLGVVSLLKLLLYKSGGSFTVTHTAQDPAVIFKAIIDYFNTQYPAGLISYSGGHIDNVGSSVTYTFDKKKCLDALTTTFTLAKPGWWWKIDGQGQVWLKQKPASATHVFTMGKDVEEASVDKTSETVTNQVRVQYATGNVDVTDAPSIAQFGLRDAYITDTQIGNAATATERGQKEVNDKKAEKIRAKLIINNFYDIETIAVGDTCKVKGVNKDSVLFSDNMQIVSVDYDPSSVSLELEEISTNFGNEMENFISND
jgi:hypothetical protein